MKVRKEAEAMQREALFTLRKQVIMLTDEDATVCACCFESG